MGSISILARRVPIIRMLYKEYSKWAAASRLKSMKTEQIFTEIYKNNGFGGKDSISGPGSDYRETEEISRALPLLIKEYQLSTILDIPCGDFHWMRRVDLSDITYAGADIVEELIQINESMYHTERMHFKKLNILVDDLPQSDLILCRDCLVHFSDADIKYALDNICASKSRYLLTTTFTDRKSNTPIPTGLWRPLNLQAAPFFLPPPLAIINEKCSESAGYYSDKSLALWKLSDIANR